MSKDQSHGRKANRLINEQSPYLRQHAHNPVDWYPWSEEALARARAENKPIMLSIGYSACHWCHVMERESFEDEQIAELINQHFVPIKVDREERPDLDQIYMDAVQLFTGRGGWPLTMFLTPEGKPFFGGTYYPPADRQGMPGFPRVLMSVAQAYRERIQDVEHNVERLTKSLSALSEFTPVEGELRADLPAAAAEAVAQHYDNLQGGLGQAPKFPNSFVFSLFLRVGQDSGDRKFNEMVSFTLDRMAKGGIYDQVGGGFHRYSVDAQWLVPHFEKMLYDNALLARLYLDAARALDRNDFLQVGREILDYVLREMTSPEGGFYSTQDADSEGEEGKFFIWSADEVREAVGDKLWPIAESYFNVTEEGNFEEKNILSRSFDRADAARFFKISEEEVDELVAELRHKLFVARERRVKPGRDEKILAAWNGMMIGALAEGYRALGEPRYLAAAKRALEFVMTKLWDGRALRRSYKDGVARFNGYLEDYALIANAMLDVYEAALEQRYLDDARELIEIILTRFADPERGGFYFTSDDHERLITRSKPAFDGSTPSGNSSTILALLRIHAYSGEERYLNAAERALKLFRPFMEKQPFAFSHMLEVVHLYHRKPKEIALVGARDSAEFRRWLERLGLLYLPNRALFALDPTSAASFVPEALRGKQQIDGKLTGFVCQEYTCSMPQTTIEGIEAELKR